MGNYIAADILPYLQPELQIDKVIFECSPSHIEQAKQGAQIQASESAAISRRHPDETVSRRAELSAPS